MIKNMMMNLLRISSGQRAFFVPYIIFLIIGVFVSIFFDKITLHLYQNQFHTLAFDDFFKIGTKMGEAIFISIIVIIGSLINYRYAVFIFTGVITSSLLTQVLKRTIFSDYLRPVKLIGREMLYLVENVEVHAINSFPSGHTTAVYALFSSVAILSKNSWIQFLCFFLAFIGGYSRVYLSQHFWMDTVAGSLVGVSVVVTTFYMFNRRNFIPKKA